MTEYWVSQAKHWCPYCKIFINGSKSSVSAHDQGLKHKDSMNRFLKESRKKDKEKHHEDADVMKQLREIEKAAYTSFKQQDSAWTYPKPSAAKKQPVASEFVPTAEDTEAQRQQHEWQWQWYQQQQQQQQQEEHTEEGSQQEAAAAEPQGQEQVEVPPPPPPLPPPAAAAAAAEEVPSSSSSSHRVDLLGGWTKVERVKEPPKPVLPEPVEIRLSASAKVRQQNEVVFAQAQKEMEVVEKPVYHEVSAGSSTGAVFKKRKVTKPVIRTHTEEDTQDTSS